MSEPNESAKLNIGAVAKATGIPASTLRTWERRYGYPSPERTEGGHRVYEPSVVERLELVAEALDEGHRAGRVVGRSTDELRRLLGRPSSDESSEEVPTEADATDDGASDETRAPSAAPDASDETSEPAAPPRPGGSRIDEHGSWLEDWLEATTDLDLGDLRWQFEDAWNRLGALGFLQDRITPYLHEVGIGWAEGRFDIVHEHHASEVLRDFLASKWRPLVERANGPKSLVGALPDERHVLGLHMASVALAMAGWEIGMLGPDVPIDELVRAVEAQEPEALAVAVASSYDSDRARRALEMLVERLPEGVELLVGGGTPDDVEGTRAFDDLEALYDWARRYE